MNKITSKSNPLVKKLNKIANQRKFRESENVFLIEGWRSLKSFVDNKHEFYEIEFVAYSDQYIFPEPLPKNINCIEFSNSIFKSFSSVKESPGIATILKIKPTLPEWNKYNKILLLDSIQDPGNLGSLIRSAVGANYDAILLYGNCVDYTNLKALRSSMGTFPFINIHLISESELLDIINTYSINLLGLVCDQRSTIEQVNIEKPFIIAIGSEANGLDSSLLELCNQKATIKLNPKCESLNAAVAGSIAMFHYK